MTRLSYLLGVLLVLSISVNFYLLGKSSISIREADYPNNRISQREILIKRVVDGDTFILEDDTRMRLSNVEAPELQNCGGQEAKSELAELIEGEKVKLSLQGEDAFNRSLALVYVDELLVNNQILAKGLARYDGTPNSERDRMRKSHQNAVSENLGIFGSPCRSEKPDSPGCLIKGNIDRHGRIKKYLLPTCPNYQQTIVEKDLGEVWFCTESEAREAGFAKASQCN